MNLRLRSAHLGDMYFLLQLRNLPDVVAVSRSKRLAQPRWVEVVRKRLKIIEVDGQRVGYLLLTPVSEVSVALIPEARGKGYGTEALGCLHGRLIARILPENAVSVRSFQKAGFSQETECQVFFKDKRA